MFSFARTLYSRFFGVVRLNRWPESKPLWLKRRSLGVLVAGTQSRSHATWNKYFTHQLLRIHDILGWIRIRIWIWIHGSILLTNGSRSGCRSCYFRHWPSQNANKKLITKNFFAFYFLKVHVHHFQRWKTVKKKSQSRRNQCFSYFFARW
jgi:hypothetical protein